MGCKHYPVPFLMVCFWYLHTHVRISLPFATKNQIFKNFLKKCLQCYRFYGTEFLNDTLFFNTYYPGEVIILCRKIAISLEPNLCLTSDQSVNSSLSVGVQKNETRALYLSGYNCGGPTKFENIFFRIAKFRF